MNSLVLLTRYDNTKAVVNLNRIVTIEQYDRGCEGSVNKKIPNGCSCIYFGDDNYLYVKDSPEDIYNMFYKKVEG